MNNATATIELSHTAWILLNQSDFYTEVIDVTPQLATELLTRNKANRKLYDKKVKEYAEYMQKGAWKLNGEPVIISDAGILRNGQHRLNAVLASGCTVKMSFVAGVEDSTYTTLDTGKKRTGGDVLAIEDYKNANIIAGGLREYVALQKGLPSPNYLASSTSLSIDDVYNMAQERGKERCEQVSHLALTYYSQSRLYGPSLIFGFIILLDELHPDKWQPFMDKVFNNIGLEDESPEYALVSALRKNQISIKKVPLPVARAWFIKAFNRHLLGKKQQQVQFNPEKEKFPKFIGQ